MSESALLFLILSAIYLWECILWVRRDAMAFLATWGDTWRPAHPSPSLGNQSGGLLFGHPLPLFGASILSQPWPMSISPEGVCARVSHTLDPVGRPPQSGIFHRFEQVRSVISLDREVMINGAAFVRAASNSQARRLAGLVRELAALPPAGRERAIRAALRGGFETQRISERLEEFRRRTRALRILCTAQFALLFGAAPAVVWFFGLASTWVWLLSGAVALHAAILITCARAYRALYPEDRAGRRSHLAVMALSPPAAIRARDLLARELLSGSHPLAVALVLCGREELQAFAARAVRDARFPVADAGATEDRLSRSAEEWFHQAQRQALESFARESGLSVEELLAPPPRQDPAVASFCPRCHAQYRTQGASCPDCVSVPLMPLPPPAEASAGADRVAAPGAPAATAGSPAAISGSPAVR
jgi:hypothetical protein